MEKAFEELQIKDDFMCGWHGGCVRRPAGGL